tara:strand:- start:3561 stop:3986 length:426 start_codon:yes stop_codon:yes gene_type:complete
MKGINSLLITLSNMSLKESLKYCVICKNRKIDRGTGLICSLSNKKPDFIDECKDFILDEKEDQRRLILELNAAGNIGRSPDPSPKSNQYFGVFLIVLGFILSLIVSIWGIIMVVVGIMFIIKSNQQKKILKKKNNFNTLES